MKWIKASERLPDKQTDEQDDAIYVLRRKNREGKWNMDIVGFLKGHFILVDQPKPIVPKEDLHLFEWLNESIEGEEQAGDGVGFVNWLAEEGYEFTEVRGKMYLGGKYFYVHELYNIYKNRHNERTTDT